MAGAHVQTSVQVVRVGIDQKTHSVVTLKKREGTTELRSRLVVIATGANLTLLPNSSRVPASIAHRGYFDLQNPIALDSLNLYFSDVTLPGYGWVFPVSATRVNIGVGVFASGPNRHPKDAAGILKRMLTENESVARIANMALPVGPARGYPLRTDFPTRPLAGPGWIVVGEAAGLVSPVSGDGIDLALESGRLAALRVAKGLRNDNLREMCNQYVIDLKQNYASSFRTMRFMAETMLQPRMIGVVFGVAYKAPKVARWILRSSLRSR